MVDKYDYDDDDIYNDVVITNGNVLNIGDGEGISAGSTDNDPIIHDNDETSSSQQPPSMTTPTTVLIKEQRSLQLDLNHKYNHNSTSASLMVQKNLIHWQSVVMMILI